MNEETISSFTDHKLHTNSMDGRFPQRQTIFQRLKSSLSRQKCEPRGHHEHLDAALRDVPANKLPPISNTSLTGRNPLVNKKMSTLSQLRPKISTVGGRSALSHSDATKPFMQRESSKSSECLHHPLYNSNNWGEMNDSQREMFRYGGYLWNTENHDHFPKGSESTKFLTSLYRDYRKRDDDIRNMQCGYLSKMTLDEPFSDKNLYSPNLIQRRKDNVPLDYADIDEIVPPTPKIHISQTSSDPFPRKQDERYNSTKTMFPY